MLIIGTRSPLFGYRHNYTTGALLSRGAGPGGSALTVTQSRSQLSLWSILKSPLLASADFLAVAGVLHICQCHHQQRVALSASGAATFWLGHLLRWRHIAEICCWRRCWCCCRCGGGGGGRWW